MSLPADTHVQHGLLSLHPETLFSVVTCNRHAHRPDFTRSKSDSTATRFSNVQAVQETFGVTLGLSRQSGRLESAPPQMTRGVSRHSERLELAPPLCVRIQNTEGEELEVLGCV